MDWQNVIVYIIVGLAVLYLLRVLYRKIKPRGGGCGHNCGCHKPGAELPKKDQHPSP